MMHEELWKQLIALDPADTAKRAQCKYISESGLFIVVLLGSEYLVDPTEKKISPAEKDHNTKDADFIEQLCILAYLINAEDIPITNKLVTANKLEGGQFFFRGPHALPTDKLEKAFGSDPSLIYKAAENLPAERSDYGDASIKILVLPRLPVYFVIWAGDDEFPPRVSTLFDQTASKQLPHDAIWAAVNLTTKALIS
jgi:hypothetical protein